MKNRIVILIALPIFLIGCSNNANKSSSTKEHTLVLNYGFVFNHIKTQEGEDLAKLLLNDSYYSFSSEIKIDRPIVAGDQLSITFDGEYEAICREIYPAQCDVTGKIKKYSLIETQILGMQIDAVEGAGANAIANDLRNGYILDNEFVILDETGRYTSLDEYNGNTLFLSYNLQKMNDNCSCPEGAMCGPCPVYISALYAYNPRPAS